VTSPGVAPTPDPSVLARPSGGYAMLAIDQREAMRAMFARHQAEPVSDEQVTAFKLAAARILTPYASAVLVDRQFAWDRVVAESAVAPGCALIAAADEFRPAHGELVGEVSIDRAVDPQRVKQQGAKALKLLVLYRPDTPAKPRIEMVEEFVDICRSTGLVSIIEPVSRAPLGGGDWDWDAGVLAAAEELGDRGALPRPGRAGRDPQTLRGDQRGRLLAVGGALVRGARGRVPHRRRAGLRRGRVGLPRRPRGVGVVHRRGRRGARARRGGDRTAAAAVRHRRLRGREVSEAVSRIPRVTVVATARPTFVTDVARQRADAARALLAELGADVTGPEELVMTPDDVETAATHIDGTADLVVNVCASFSDASPALRLYRDLDRPVLLWAFREPGPVGDRLWLNSLCGANLFGHALVRAGGQVRLVYGDPDEPHVADTLRSALAGDLPPAPPLPQRQLPRAGARSARSATPRPGSRPASTTPTCWSRCSA